MLDQLAAGLAEIMTWERMGFALLGCFLGTFFGVMPGLGPVTAIAVLFPITTYLDPLSGIVMLAAIYYGGMYGGSTTAILVNIPGEVASLPAALEGYPMTQRGRAGAALAVAAISSFTAGIIGSLGVIILGSSVAHLALRFGPPEMLGLVLFALTAVAGLVSGSMFKGLSMAALGILLSMVGYDMISGSTVMTGGTWTLAQGFAIVPVMIGLFGIGEILRTLTTRGHSAKSAPLGKLMPTKKELKDSVAPTARGTAQGFSFGLIPGMLPSIMALLSYSWERQRAEKKGGSQFGNGDIRGIAGPEAANNGAAMGGFVPLLSLGIPTGPSMALVLGALMVYGLTPGPTMFTQNAEFTSGILVSFLVANVILLILNLPLVPMWARLARVPFHVMGPLVLILCLVGAYLDRNSFFDIFVCLGAGIFALLCHKASLPLAPLVMGFILGPMLQETMRQSIAMSGTFYLERPIFMAFAGVAILTIAWSIWRARRHTTSLRRAEASS
ncbi:tripartite tricarboxylate transporter permease [Nesterenkonia ebinurensis]|uniref:tripartite tricarboxylate transporter permease n=1 Tax=Nesterenkonia ebinurensis TaxID=2608252 RepID=UPI001CC79D79|nr:tripartite tricarboxylate transporter permease [Nesterenkonia ebinurensis]